MSISIRDIDNEELWKLCVEDESHFFDRKSEKIKPSKLSKSLSAFANTDGGELAIGISDDGNWEGYRTQEEANDLIRTVSELLNSAYYDVEYLRNPESGTYVLLVTITRHPRIVSDSQGEFYLREGAQNKKAQGEILEQLKRSKGVGNYELTKTNCPSAEIENSETMIEFMIDGNVFSEPSDFLKRNKLVSENYAVIAAVMLFSEIPQSYLPNSGAKIYRYSTSDEASRPHLEGVPETLEGPIIDLIQKSKDRIFEIISTIPTLGENGLTHKEYPSETLHEILTNAFLHRDYGISDYVHIIIFDNRIEIDSPGRLHGQVTVETILDERSARNPQIQRILNKFPGAPNKDIGEGLNTAFDAMEALRLSPPEIQELSDRVKVTIKHEPLASPEEAIMEYIRKNGSINNAQAREVSKIAQERTIRRKFEELVLAGEIKRVGRARGTYYILASSDDDEGV